nr:MAG TPA: hypothetical protein [Caudoviricetes sp.]
MEGKEKSGNEVTIDYEAFAALVGLCKAACEVGQRLMAGTLTGDREVASRTLLAGNALAGSIVDSGAVDLDDAVKFASEAMCCSAVRCTPMRDVKEGD